MLLHVKGTGLLKAGPFLGCSSDMYSVIIEVRMERDDDPVEYLQV